MEKELMIFAEEYKENHVVEGQIPEGDIKIF